MLATAVYSDTAEVACTPWCAVAAHASSYSCCTGVLSDHAFSKAWLGSVQACGIP